MFHCTEIISMKLLSNKTINSPQSMEISTTTPYNLNYSTVPSNCFGVGNIVILIGVYNTYCFGSIMHLKHQGWY